MKTKELSIKQKSRSEFQTKSVTFSNKFDDLKNSWVKTKVPCSKLYKMQIMSYLSINHKPK